MTKEEAEKRGNREGVYILNDSSPLRDRLLEIASGMKDEAGDYELAYEITARACDIVAEALDGIGEGEKIDADSDGIRDACDGSASVYTADRLAYLNVCNQGEIAERVREYGCDIQEASAYWYDGLVHTAVERVIAMVNEE